MGGFGVAWFLRITLAAVLKTDWGWPGGRNTGNRETGQVPTALQRGKRNSDLDLGQFLSRFNCASAIILAYHTVCSTGTRLLFHVLCWHRLILESCYCRWVSSDPFTAFSRARPYFYHFFHSSVLFRFHHKISTILLLSAFKFRHLSLFTEAFPE